MCVSECVFVEGGSQGMRWGLGLYGVEAGVNKAALGQDERRDR